MRQSIETPTSPLGPWWGIWHSLKKPPPHRAKFSVKTCQIASFPPRSRVKVKSVCLQCLFFHLLDQNIKLTFLCSIVVNNPPPWAIILINRMSIPQLSLTLAQGGWRWGFQLTFKVYDIRDLAHVWGKWTELEPSQNEPSQWVKCLEILANSYFWMPRMPFNWKCKFDSLLRIFLMLIKGLQLELEYGEWCLIFRSQGGHTVCQHCQLSTVLKLAK